MELLITAEEFGITCAASIDALGFSIGVLTYESALGSAMTKDFESQRIELILQDRVIQLDRVRSSIGFDFGKWRLALAHLCTSLNSCIGYATPVEEWQS